MPPRILTTLLLCIALASKAQSPEAQHQYERALKLEQADPSVSYQAYYSLTTKAEAGSALQKKYATRMAIVAANQQLPESFRDKSYPALRKILNLIDSTKTDSISAAFLLASGKMYDAAYKIDSAVILLSNAKNAFYKLEPAGGVNEADACDALGDIYKYELYFFDKAEEYYERALSIREKITPGNIRTLTRLYYNLATTNRSQSDYESAISWAMKAIDGCERMQDDKFLERTCSVVGNIYRDMHLYDSAIRYYQKGVATNRVINNGKDNETMAGLFVGWGEVFFLQQKFNAAAEKLGDAARIYRKNGTREKLLFLHCLKMLALVELERDQYEKSFAILTEAGKLAQGLQVTGGPISEYNKSWGDYYLKTGDTTKALAQYQQALIVTTKNFEDADPYKNPSADEVEMKGFAYNALLSKADVLRLKSRGDGSRELRAAIESYQLAEKLMVKSRSELDTEDAKWSFVDANFSLYEKMMTAMSDGHADSETFFHYMESSKSKTLADALREAELKKTIGGDKLFQQLRSLRQKTLALQHQIDEKNNASVRDELITTARAISATEDQIKLQYPSYFKTKSEGSSVSLQSIMNKMKQLNGVFIEYFWGSENIFAMIVTADGSEFRTLGKPSAISPQLERLSHFFAATTNDYSPQAVIDFASASNDVYNFILKPFETKLSGNVRMIIVPDGPLSQLPFETLVTQATSEKQYNRLPYLIQEHAVSYGMSGSYVLGEDRMLSQKPSILAFGFTGGSDVRSGANVRQDIAGSETELIALSEKFPEGTYLFGPDVTEENFKKRAADYNVIHLAVHGSGDVSQNYSAVLYFRDKQGAEDGKLHWYELYGMNLKASLAVLSSCESGIGKTYRGEGMLSMANAFTFAGCNNIVMGLWKVDDQVSVKLMDTFYSKLLDGMTIDQALAIAKTTYLAGADQVSANPKLWGSLVAFGESPILTADRIHPMWVLVALGVLMTAIFFLVRKTKK